MGYGGIQGHRNPNRTFCTDALIRSYSSWKSSGYGGTLASAIPTKMGPSRATLPQNDGARVWGHFGLRNPCQCPSAARAGEWGCFHSQSQARGSNFDPHLADYLALPTSRLVVSVPRLSQPSRLSSPASMTNGLATRGRAHSQARGTPGQFTTEQSASTVSRVDPLTQLQ